MLGRCEFVREWRDTRCADPIAGLGAALLVNVIVGAGLLGGVVGGSGLCQFEPGARFVPGPSHTAIIKSWTQRLQRSFQTRGDVPRVGRCRRSGVGFERLRAVAESFGEDGNRGGLCEFVECA